MTKKKNLKVSNQFFGRQQKITNFCLSLASLAFFRNPEETLLY